MVGYLNFLYIPHVCAILGISFSDFSQGLFTQPCESSRHEREGMSRDVCTQDKDRIGQRKTYLLVRNFFQTETQCSFLPPSIG
jgi:hypothetical protein